MIFALQISQENKAENVLDDDVECCGPAREEKRSERVSCDRDTKAEAIGPKEKSARCRGFAVPYQHRKS